MGSDSKSGDKKPARLINLTLALLATKRLLTKSEILTSVEGYEGYHENPATVERMFERDKDELRQLGIEIQVESIDPYFDDELGYRILPSSYALRISDLSSKDVALLSLAASLWRDSALSESAQKALRKLKSLGIPADFSDVGVLEAKVEQPDSNLLLISEAIEKRQAIDFEYASKDSRKRKVHPFALSFRSGSWYLVGQDVEVSQIRIFKLIRIQGDINIYGKAGSFHLPSDFDLKKVDFFRGDEKLQVAQVRLLRERATTLREMGNLKFSEADFDIFEIEFESPHQFLDEILWNTPYVEVLEPQDLRQRVIERLTELTS